MRGGGALLALLLIVLVGAVAALLYVGGDDAAPELTRAGARTGTRAETDAGAESLAETGSASRTAATGAALGPEDSSPPEDREAPVATQEPTPAAIIGRVVDPAGAPVPGADVMAIPDEEATFNTFDSGLRVPGDSMDDLTGEDGRFQLEVDSWGGVKVVVRAQGYASLVREGCRAGQELELVVHPASSLSGTVTSVESAAPVVAAIVRVFHGPDQDAESTARTDALGRYGIVGLNPGEASLQVIPVEFASTRMQTVQLAPGAETEHDVSVEVGWVLTGQVRDAHSGAPIAGAEVSSWNFYQKTVRTDAGGFYRLPGVRKRMGTLHARAADYGRTEVRFSGPDDPLDFELEPGLTLFGRVTDTSGDPIVHARVSACGSAHDADLHRMEWTTQVTPNGEFRLTDLRRDVELVVFARSSGLGSLRHAVARPEPGTSEVDLGDLVLSRGARVEGRVLTHARRPLERVLVELRGPEADTVPDGLVTYLKLRQSQTDEHGGFGFADLAAGEYVLRMVRPDGTSLQTDLELDPGEHMTGFALRFAPGGRLSGVVRGPGGAPLGDAFVTLLPEAAGGNSLETRTDRRGEFAFTDAPSEPFTVRASPSDEDTREVPLAPAIVHGVVPDDRYLELDLLPADAWIEGAVVDAAGAPVPLALVSVDHGDGLRRDGVLTGDAGRFRLRVPSSGTWPLRAWATAELGEGNVTVLEWTLQRRILSPEGPARLEDVEPGTQDAVLRLAR